MLPKPPIQVEPAYTYSEVAAALGVSLSLIQKECARGRLRSRRLGRHSVIAQTDIDEWWEGRYERRLDVRAARVTRKDQKPQSKKGLKREVNADPDILAGLGLTKK